MISVDQKDAMGRVVGLGWAYTTEELAALPPPRKIVLPVSLDDRISALEMVATGAAKDLAAAAEAVKASKIAPVPVKGEL
jgi:hypothetical protein